MNIEAWDQTPLATREPLLNTWTSFESHYFINNIFTNLHTHARTHIYAHIHTYLHAYTHTRIKNLNAIGNTIECIKEGTEFQKIIHVKEREKKKKADITHEYSIVTILLQ